VTSDGDAFVEVEGQLTLPGGEIVRLRDFGDASAAGSNISCHDAAETWCWDAELLHPLDKWVSLALEEGTLFATSWEGYRCELGPEDGKVLSSVFVK
jgi:hypothetical protein